MTGSEGNLSSSWSPYYIIALAYIILLLFLLLLYGFIKAGDFYLNLIINNCENLGECNLYTIFYIFLQEYKIHTLYYLLHVNALKLKSNNSTPTYFKFSPDVYIIIFSKVYTFKFSNDFDST